jgi:hypothetical protein
MTPLFLVFAVPDPDRESDCHDQEREGGLDDRPGDTTVREGQGKER